MKITRLKFSSEWLDFYSKTTSLRFLLLDIKLLIKSIISDIEKGVRFIIMDLKDYFP